MKLSNKVYDALKWIALICFPAIEMFWITLAKIWGFPYGTEIAGTLAALGTLIGALIGISTIQYRKGLNHDENGSDQ